MGAGRDHGLAILEVEWMNAEDGSWSDATDETTEILVAVLLSACQQQKLYLVWLLLVRSFCWDYFNLSSPGCLVFTMTLTPLELTKDQGCLWISNVLSFTSIFSALNPSSFLKKLSEEYFLLLIHPCNLCFILLSFNVPFCHQVAFD